MKLISLNIWGGKAFAPLLEFIKNFAKETDIFCFQEVFHSTSGVIESHGGRVNIIDDISKILPDFIWYFSPTQDHYDLAGPVNFDSLVGQATFIRKKIPLESEGSVVIYHPENNGSKSINIPANLHYVRFSAESGKHFTICNFHGVAFPGHKLDTPARLSQSRKLKDFLDKENGAKILCGDFNLLPQAESVAILEENMINLIKKFNIRETRGKLSSYFGQPGAQHFADYIFVSSDVQVLNFEVPNAGVSDHEPMVLEFT